MVNTRLHHFKYIVHKVPVSIEIVHATTVTFVGVGEGVRRTLRAIQWSAPP